MSREMTSPRTGVVNANLPIRATVIALVALFLLSTAVLSFATTAQAQPGVSWDFRLLGPLNQAQDPGSVFTMTLIGSGSFTCSANPCTSGTIQGGGRYTVIDGGGSVIGSGTWVATTLTIFTPWGPGHSPREGGHLELQASFTGYVVGNSVPVVIQCSMWSETAAPPGYPWPPDYVEAGSYVTHVTGAVMFNLNQA